MSAKKKQKKSKKEDETVRQLPTEKSIILSVLILVEVNKWLILNLIEDKIIFYHQI